MSQEAKKILNAHLYGVHKERISNHHAFENCVINAMQDYSNHQNKLLKEENQNLQEALKRLCYLNSCEMEGLSSGMPTAKDWFEAFLKAEQLLKSE